MVKWCKNFDSGKGRLALPLRSRFGIRFGYNFRTLEKDIKPKSIIILDKDGAAEPTMAWYLDEASPYQRPSHLSRPLVVVEDQFSAMRISKFCNGLALIGTHLSDAKLAEIKGSGTEEVIIALDEDATNKAAQMVSKISGIVDRVRLQPLEKDIKDMTNEEISQLLNMEVAA